MSKLDKDASFAFSPERIGTELRPNEREILIDYRAALEASIATPEAVRKAVGSSREWGWTEECQLMAVTHDIYVINNILETGVIC